MLELNKENFEEETKEGNVLIDFWAPWCGPCQMMAPVFEELANEFKGRVKFAKVNVEAQPELAEKNNVSGIPALVMLRDGKETERIIGALPKERLAERIESMLK